ncbi:MAG: DUF177 domain-containing protein [Pseudomonadota bacterium]
MAQQNPKPSTQEIALAAAPARAEIAFQFEPDAEDRAKLSHALDLLSLKKVRLEGVVSPAGKDDWQLNAKLGATVVQPCVVTLAPVTTRIDIPVIRQYLSDPGLPDTAGETEMPEDDTIEPIPNKIVLLDLFSEVLAIALPDFPRAQGAELGTHSVTEPGKTVMTDDDARPFAGLKALKGRFSDGENT